MYIVIIGESKSVGVGCRPDSSMTFSVRSMTNGTFYGKIRKNEQNLIRVHVGGPKTIQGMAVCPEKRLLDAAVEVRAIGGSRVAPREPDTHTVWRRS